MEPSQTARQMLHQLTQHHLAVIHNIPRIAPNFVPPVRVIRGVMEFRWSQELAFSCVHWGLVFRWSQELAFRWSQELKPNSFVSDGIHNAFA
ncbi:hypothetical protein RND71_010656 [Anisodus tanguticus]|uniref:Uncharacterized protein n=1 Tax=Anisodus tanguticus TaxID=243964 RepID=A0AAE1SM19_9SOLA|nr:hypothetical protein RND71_010656 [Anisodus tanguticus]